MQGEGAGRIKSHRTAKGLTIRQLARDVGIHPSYLSHIERKRRKPSPEILDGIASVLNLSNKERRILFQEMEYERLDAAKTNHWTDPITRTLNDHRIPLVERERLRNVLNESVERWKYERSNKSHIQRAVLVAAGWQARDLPPLKIARTVMHAVKEIKASGISEVILVTAPSAREVVRRELTKQVPQLRYHCAIQENDKGLASALLSARNYCKNEPFALVLPDDIDSKREALAEMLRLYIEYATPMIAINSMTTMVDTPGKRFYGLAALGEEVRDEPRICLVKHLWEKPKITNGRRYVIVGRYILHPEIFETIARIGRNRETGKLELTDALSQNLRDKKPLLAYELDRPLWPLAPVRPIMDTLIDYIDQPKKFERAIRVSIALYEFIACIDQPKKVERQLTAMLKNIHNPPRTLEPNKTGGKGARHSSDSFGPWRPSDASTD
jgi:UTP--glucose-1-phosphate uridylyltransferase